MRHKCLFVIIAVLSMAGVGCQRKTQWTTYRELKQHMKLHYTENLAVATEPAPSLASF